jgi:hypothetical protein
MISLKGKAFLWIGTTLLLLLASGYNAAGLYTLVMGTESSYPIDLRLRWIDQGLVYRGLPPQDWEAAAVTLPETHAPMKRVHQSSYPPWAYGSNFLFIPPLGWELTRWYFALVNLLALAVVGAWAYRVGLPHGRWAALLFIASVFAIFPLAICLSYGQFSIVVLGCLVGSLLLAEWNLEYPAGVCLGLALAKPQLAGLFVLAFLVGKRFRVLIAAGVYLALASCLTWWMTGTDPLTLLRTVSKEAENYLYLSHNPLVVELAGWFGFQRAVGALALLGVAASAGLLFLVRKEPYSLLAGFSICATLCMFWSYRKHYDCVLLAFLLVYLLWSAVQTRSTIAWIALLLVGLSLWAPIRGGHWDLPVVQYGHAAVWLFGLVTAIIIARGGTLSSAAAANSTSLPPLRKVCRVASPHR